MSATLPIDDKISKILRQQNIERMHGTGPFSSHTYRHADRTEKMKYFSSHVRTSRTLLYGEVPTEYS